MLLPIDENFSRIFPPGAGMPICVSRNLNPLDSRTAVTLSDDKAAAYRVLEELGAPTPRHIVVRAGDEREALPFLAASPGTVVVKPAQGTGGGVGVTTNVASPAQLRHAIAWAAAWSRDILVERVVEGETFRLLYLDGELLDCVVRRSPRLVGDGASRVRDLVEAENERRLEAGYTHAQAMLLIDNDMKTTLATQGLDMTSIPEAGRAFTIKRVVNENCGAENISSTHLLCEENIELGRSIAQAFGLRLVGLDIITRDAGRPLRATGGAVIDVNGDPGFYYHYFKDVGRVPLALCILRKAAAGVDRAARKTAPFSS